jgi:8-oxo-dGTP pyrophosphatase MutT (NUDIX family)
MSTQAKPAATVIVLRDSPNGPEVLMLKRSGRSGFFPNAWVYPGGRVDDADRSAATTGTAKGLARADKAFGVAALRETFEEAGVWLGQGEATQAFRDELNCRNASLADAPHLVADLGRLALWAWWVTPENEPKRYDTRFFVTTLSRAEAQNVRCDELETVEHRWIRPIDAVNQAEGGTLFMAPPTYLTLCELSEFDCGEAVMKASVDRDVLPIMPKLDIDDSQWTVVLPGDPSYPTETPVDGPTKIEFKAGRWCRS